MQYLPTALRKMRFRMCEDPLRTDIMQPYKKSGEDDYISEKPLSWLESHTAAAKCIEVDCALFVQVIARTLGHWTLPAFAVSEATFLFFDPEHAAHYAYLQPTDANAYAALGPTALSARCTMTRMRDRGRHFLTRPSLWRCHRTLR